MKLTLGLENLFRQKDLKQHYLYIFQDYFTNHILPSIQTENGLIFDGTLIDILAGSMAKGQYAQASSDNTLSIGEVSSITGTANAKRLDGNDITVVAAGAAVLTCLQASNMLKIALDASDAKTKAKLQYGSDFAWGEDGTRV